MSAEEALVTFHYTAPFDTLAIDLLGSWDNFSTSYPLTRDFRRGKSSWLGCFRFKNIVWDGVYTSFAASPRQGCLVQGGRYWYFYRLANGHEVCDPTQLSSADCPLLPGQTINFLEVPVEQEQDGNKCGQADSFTLDPNARAQRVRDLDPEHCCVEPMRPMSELSPTTKKRRLRRSRWSFVTSLDWRVKFVAGSMATVHRAHCLTAAV